MDKAQLEAMKPGELVQYAKNLGLNTKGKNPRDLHDLILQTIAGEDAADEDDDAPDTVLVDASGTHITGLQGETPEEIIAEEATLLDDDEQPGEPVNFDGMTEEEVLMHQIAQAEATKAHPAVITALYNAYERLTVKPEPQPEQPETHGTVHTAKALHTGRPPKAGSHWPSVEEAISMLAPYTKRGLVVTRVPKIPHMLMFKHGGRETAISLKQPLRTVLQHASLIMRPTGKPTEDLSYEELVDLKHKALKK